MEAGSAESKFTTMRDAWPGWAASSEDAIRECMRRANAMRGYGSIAMDVNDDKAAP